MTQRQPINLLSNAWHDGDDQKRSVAMFLEHRLFLASPDAATFVIQLVVTILLASRLPSVFCSRPIRSPRIFLIRHARRAFRYGWVNLIDSTILYYV